MLVHSALQGDSHVGPGLAKGRRVQGRITEKHLELAERTFPGICEMYAALPEKPATFLQLVWLYEDAIQALYESDRAGTAQPC